MSSKENAINIDSESNESKTTTDNQVEVNPDDYKQGDITSRTLEIGDDYLSCLTHERH